MSAGRLNEGVDILNLDLKIGLLDYYWNIGGVGNDSNKYGIYSGI